MPERTYTEKEMQELLARTLRMKGQAFWGRRIGQVMPERTYTEKEMRELLAKFLKTIKDDNSRVASAVRGLTRYAVRMREKDPNGARAAMLRAGHYLLDEYYDCGEEFSALELAFYGGDEGKMAKAIIGEKKP